MTLQRAPIALQPHIWRLHHWLFLAAFVLSTSGVIHAAFVFTHRLPAALVVVHAVAAGTCWVIAEQRRQWHARVSQVVDLATEITAAQR